MSKAQRFLALKRSDLVAERPLQLGLIEGHDRRVGRVPGSVFYGHLNADLIAEVAPLYLSGSVLDVTYGKGAWWRRFRPDPFASHDIRLDGVDFRALPEADHSWDAVCFDPPYVPRQGRWHEQERRRRRERAYRDNYGLQISRGNVELQELLFAGLAECARVARRWVLVKCTDFVNGRRFWVMHETLLAEARRLGLVCHDLIIHASGPGPGGQQIVRPLRARRAHSYLLVFSVPRIRSARSA